MSRPENIREMVMRLNDQLKNGVKYDARRNVYYLVWTARQLAIARRSARELAKKLNLE